MRQKKWTPKVFHCYLSNRLEFLYEILQIYLLKPSTSNCQVICDSLESDEVTDFLKWPPTDFSAFKNVPATTPI